MNCFLFARDRGNNPRLVQVFHSRWEIRFQERQISVPIAAVEGLQPRGTLAGCGRIRDLHLCGAGHPVPFSSRKTVTTSDILLSRNPLGTQTIRNLIVSSTRRKNTRGVFLHSENATNAYPPPSKSQEILLTAGAGRVCH